ncbi:hypothetical protein AYI68_g1964 [Smittium mucronatum]|uniref:Uncharacterized protein n=1 Tax=Smittium mucronatum TaxID=133383 RepID=A0A1R0H427_9FUNG|nr:hypothetical protein AYI68_g1964 [Smittium mucronatum]
MKSIMKQVEEKMELDIGLLSRSGLKKPFKLLVDKILNSLEEDSDSPDLNEESLKTQEVSKDVISGKNPNHNDVKAKTPEKNESITEKEYSIKENKDEIDYQDLSDSDFKSSEKTKKTPPKKTLIPKKKQTVEPKIKKQKIGPNLKKNSKKNSNSLQETEKSKPEIVSDLDSTVLNGADYPAVPNSTSPISVAKPAKPKNQKRSNQNKTEQSGNDTSGSDSEVISKRSEEKLTQPETPSDLNPFVALERSQESGYLNSKKEPNQEKYNVYESDSGIEYNEPSYKKQQNSRFMSKTPKKSGLDSDSEEITLDFLKDSMRSTVSKPEKTEFLKKKTILSDSDSD